MVVPVPTCLLNISRACVQYNLADHHAASSHVRQFEYVLRCANIGMNRQPACHTLGHISECPVRMFNSLRPEVILGRRVVAY